MVFPVYSVLPRWEINDETSLYFFTRNTEGDLWNFVLRLQMSLVVFVCLMLSSWVYLFPVGSPVGTCLPLFCPDSGSRPQWPESLSVFRPPFTLLKIDGSLYSFRSYTLRVVTVPPLSRRRRRLSLSSASLALSGLR